MFKNKNLDLNGEEYLLSRGTEKTREIMMEFVSL